MPSVGETLRRERIKRNLDLEQIARETKISSRFLDAIESEQFEKLPGGVFARSFVRQYARLLELDEEELVSSLDRMLDPAPVPLPEPDAKSRREASGEPRILLPKVEEWQSAGDSRSQFSTWLPALAGVVLVMIGCSLVYAWWQRTRQPAVENPPAVAVQTPPQQQPPAPAPQTPAPTPTPETAAAQAPTGADTKPAAVQPNASGLTPASTPPSPVTPAGQTPAPVTPAVVPPQTAPAGGGAVRVQIAALEATWMLVRDEGKVLFSGVLDSNQTRTIESNGTVLVRLGNAGGVTLSYNGKSIGSPGPKGQVRTLQFTSGGFQIVPPVPPAPKPATDPL